MVPSVRTVIHRQSYTLKHKRSTVCTVLTLVANHQATNIPSVCRHLNVNHRLFYRWTSLLEGEGKTQGETSGSASDSGETADSCKTSVVSVAPMASSKKLSRGHLRSFLLGRMGMLASHKPVLFCFFFEFQE